MTDRSQKNDLVRSLEQQKEDRAYRRSVVHPSASITLLLTLSSLLKTMFLSAQMELIRTSRSDASVRRTNV